MGVGEGVDEGAEGFELVGVEEVEEEDFGVSGEEPVEFGADFGFGEGELEDVEESDFLFGLTGEVEAEVAFVGGRDWVAAHGGVPVEAVNFAVATDAHAGEEVSEHAVAAEGRSAPTRRGHGAGLEDVQRARRRWRGRCCRWWGKESKVEQTL